jgi:hypothetical protein
MSSRSVVSESDILRTILTKYSLSNIILKHLVTSNEQLGLVDGGDIKYVGKSTIPGHTRDDMYLITKRNGEGIKFYVEGGADMLNDVSYIETPIDTRIKYVPEIVTTVPVITSSATCTSCKISGGASRRRNAKRHGKQRRTRHRISRKTRRS